MLASLDPHLWNETLAAHLLNRAGFGGSPAEIAALGRHGFPGAVDWLLARMETGEAFARPEWATPRNLAEQRRKFRQLPEEQRKMEMQQQQREQRQNMVELVHWWMRRMRDGADPLREKMTLFWHGHFATSVQKVRDPFLMWRQNETLRAGALGNFGELLKAMAEDSAMMVWLDTQQSRKQQPNENFPRELMELFTLGIGHYTENDIREAARAFTPYKIDREDQSFRYVRFQEDNGQKKFLGRTGRFNGDDVLAIILQQPACAEFIVHKLWEFFVYEDPGSEVLLPLAQTFRQSKYEIKPVLREMFLSAEFYSPRAVRTQIKSPVQWTVGSAKALEAPLPEPMPLHNVLQQLGQVPFAPPNVKGWDGGKAWITTSTLLLRYNLAAFLVGADTMNFQRRGANKAPVGPGREIPNRILPPFERIAPPELRKDHRALVASLSHRLFQISLPDHDTAPFLEWLANHRGAINDDAVAGLLHLMMSTPQYQLT